MGMLAVLGVVVLLVAILAAFIHAVRTDRPGKTHGWLVLMP